MKICKWNWPFCNFTQIYSKLSLTSKRAKWKLTKWEKLKLIFEKSILEISKMDGIIFWTQFDPTESFRKPVGVEDVFNENKISDLHNSEILKNKI